MVLPRSDGNTLVACRKQDGSELRVRLYWLEIRMTIPDVPFFAIFAIYRGVNNITKLLEPA